MGECRDRVRFNVGGKIFETTATTLTNAGRDSYFGALFDDNWELRAKGQPETIFIDRNPHCFAVFLDLLRTGELNVPPNVPKKSLYRDASFYGLLDHVRAAKWGKLDGNRLQLSHTVSEWAEPEGSGNIWAGPDGGCCVSHGRIVHVYDWTMEKHRTLNLNYMSVNDVGFIDPENVVIGTNGKEGTFDGGMAAFSVSSGEIRHKFALSKDGLPKGFTARSLCSDDNRIFSICKGWNNDSGIGVWDQITGKQMDFYYESPDWSIGDANKLQWLVGRNCLLVSKFSRRYKADRYCISMLDPRQRKMAWSWSYGDYNSKFPFKDVVAAEETNSVCVTNSDADLGFIDTRMYVSGINSVNWSWIHRQRMLIDFNKETPLWPSPKLALHRDSGQLFLTTKDLVLVFCGPSSNCVQSSRRRISFGVDIADISVDGDRLFALRANDSKFEFDVWDTPM